MHVLVRDLTDAELLANAYRDPPDRNDGVYTPFYNPDTGRDEGIYIVGRLTNEPGQALGGAVFEDTTGGDGGQQIKLFTLAEIKQAPRRNMSFIHDWGPFAEIFASVGPNGKFVMPFGVARVYGWV